jgi:hypothetical protein
LGSFLFERSGGGRFNFRFNVGPKARFALRLGEGPRALGFSISIIGAAYLLNFRV